MSGRIGLYYFPEYFFGVGNANFLNIKEQIVYNRFRFELNAAKKLDKGIFGGIRCYANSIQHVSYTSGGLMDLYNYLGKNGYQVVGLGPILTIDKRDKVIASYTGYFLEASILRFQKDILSSVTFTDIRLEYRKYWKLHKTQPHIIAIQSLSLIKFGDIPWKDMSEFGGANVMRGYYAGRYRDNCAQIIQAEYRFPIYRRLSGATWVAAASTFRDFNSLSEAQILPSVGLGLRVNINKADRVNIRLDAGFGKNSQGQYIDILEAF